MRGVSEHACVHGGQSQPQGLPTLFSQTGSLIGLELTDWTRPLGQQAPGILGLPFLIWWQVADPVPAFFCFLEIELRSWRLCGRHFTNWSVSQAPRCLCLHSHRLNDIFANLIQARNLAMFGCFFFSIIFSCKLKVLVDLTSVFKSSMLLLSDTLLTPRVMMLGSCLNFCKRHWKWFSASRFCPCQTFALRQHTVSPRASYRACYESLTQSFLQTPSFLSHRGPSFQHYVSVLSLFPSYMLMVLLKAVFTFRCMTVFLPACKYF